MSVDFDAPDFEHLPNSPVVVNMFAGAIAGITEHCVMYPVDSIKTRMQTLSSRSGRLYSSVAKYAVRISRTEGAGALWRGMNSAILGAGPAHALSFAVYEQFKDALSFGQSSFEVSVLNSAAAGACATIAHDGLMTPFDVIKQRMQLQSGARFTGTLSCAFYVMRTEGARAFFVSYPTTLWMNIPFHMIHFSTYEAVKRRLHGADWSASSAATHCVAGGVAGGLAALATTPLDVVKTVLQTRGASDDARVREVRGFVEAARVVLQRDGVRGFLRGARARVLVHVPGTAVTWTTYEFLKRVLVSDGERERERERERARGLA
ncbi:Fe(2+) transporter [Entophlyctis luteolus]|nr:Fe(2+) transporter [Entophlyctis luteolus]KAJ3392749.1 Fe(2+) transporter [Entophlyctis sp. JEL0112]